jgi:hypothetical protein
MTTTEIHVEATPEIIQKTICAGIEEIGDFIVQSEFQSLLAELYALPHEARLRFVQDIIIDNEQRLSRGIKVPEGMVIQRSTFADGRPTLFCVSKILPLAYPWHRVTITFDSSLEESSA